MLPVETQLAEIFERVLLGHQRAVGVVSQS